MVRPRRDRAGSQPRGVAGTCRLARPGARGRANRPAGRDALFALRVRRARTSAAFRPVRHGAGAAQPPRARLRARDPAARSRARNRGDRHAPVRRGGARPTLGAPRGSRAARRQLLGAGAPQVGVFGRPSRPGDSLDSQSGSCSCQRGSKFASVVRCRAAAASRTARRMRPDESKTVYDGKLIDVVVERWGDHQREIVDHPGAVAIVAVDSEGMLTLVRQRREAVREELLELPAGTLEAGETPLECARRELAEETGLTGGSWREAATFYTTPGFCRERMHLFFAEKLERGEASPESDEELEVVRWPTSDIATNVLGIEDAKTIAGLLLYLHKVG